MKSLPHGISVAGETRAVSDGDVEFLHDVTYRENGRRVAEQAIYDRALGVIRRAEDFILADLFLFNDYVGKDAEVHRHLCAEVTDALLERKRARPGIAIVVITDPVNEVYGGAILPSFAALRAAGIPVVATSLEKLRDSNATYSAFWRVFIQWLGNSRGGGHIRHPFAGNARGVTLRSWLALLNFKANHRKLIVADAPAIDQRGRRGMVALVMSANPHDGSSAHNNIALLVRGGAVWRDLVRSEQAVLAFSAPGIDLESQLPAYAREEHASTTDIQPEGATVRLVTEEKIRAAILARIAGAGCGDAIDLAMFYLSERLVIEALLDACSRGVAVRVLLDPNRDAFGYRKNGVPNRPVAAELVARSGGKISVRWYDTHGEQFHPKMVLVGKHRTDAGGNLAESAVLFVGSANLTRRNIGDFNLETDVELAGPASTPALRAASAYFERLWTNDGHEYTLPFAAYGENSLLKRWMYRVQESTGLGTF